MRIAWSLVAALLMFPSAVFAQRESMLTTPAWLAQHLADPDLVVLHVGPKADYDAAHIPGARHVALNDMAAPRVDGGLTLEMMPAEDFRQKLASLGVSDNSRIVVAFTGAGITQATRIIFALDTFGLGDRATLLDGGMTAWTKGGHPVTTEVPAPRAGSLSPLKTRPLVITADDVVARMKQPNVTVVDGRTDAFYSGAQTGGGQAAPHKTGHIDGAVSVPYVSLVDENQQLKPKADLEAAFAKAGVKPGDTVIGYCHIGQQATAMLFAARSLGYPVLLYDGSFEDWSRRNLPVTTVKKDK
ncbi:MAG TPA: rhodanese-like domain-containing protein [Vicinamibacterales bacterium]|nr:rhodanese-like domain-containing protein [Vicinamibacterales bacterium]